MLKDREDGGERREERSPFILRPPLSSLLPLVLLAGCYEYLPAPRADTLIGRRVQVTLTDEGSAVLAPMIGPSGETVGGTLRADTASTFVISVMTVKNRMGWESSWKGEQVNVPHRVVVRLEERQLSKSRTTLSTILLAAALVTAQRAFSGPGGTNAPGPSPTGPPGGR